jgi:GNAT superfamily N-acetyltransferase
VAVALSLPSQAMWPWGVRATAFFPDYAYAERIAVLPGHRRRGIAVALVAAFEQAVRARGAPEAPGASAARAQMVASGSKQWWHQAAHTLHVVLPKAHVDAAFRSTPEDHREVLRRIGRTR